MTVANAPLWLRVLNDTLLLVGTLAGWGFIGRYVTTYRWWQDALGAHLIVFSACVAAFYSYFTVFAIWPNLPGRTFIRTFLFIALTAAIVWRLAIFERVRHQTKRDKKEQS